MSLNQIHFDRSVELRESKEVTKSQRTVQETSGKGVAGAGEEPSTEAQPTPSAGTTEDNVTTDTEPVPAPT